MLAAKTCNYDNLLVGLNVYVGVAT
jgi:hypothetical protein